MKHQKIKQIGAIAIIVILVGMYVATLVLAIVDPTATKTMFRASLFLTIALPILLWLYIFLYGFYARKHTIADMDILKNVDPQSMTIEPDKKASSKSSDADTKQL